MYNRAPLLPPSLVEDTQDAQMIDLDLCFPVSSNRFFQSLDSIVTSLVTRPGFSFREPRTEAALRGYQS